MGLLSPFRNRCRTNRDFNGLDKVGSQITSTIATTAAALLMIASAGFGTVFAYTQGVHHGPTLAAFAVAMALGLELAKPFAIEGVFSCLRAWAIGRALAMALLGFVAISFSLTAELSLMATTRGDAAAERAKVSNATKDDRAQLERLIVERAALMFTAATADTVTAAREAVAAAERTRAAECAKRGPQCRARETDEAVARTTLAKAIADKAATDRTAKLDADAATLRARLATASPVAAASDPGAAALASYLGTFGLSLSAGLVSEWMVLIGVIALELGSALAVVLVRAAGASHSSASPRTARQAASVDRQAVDGRERAPASKALDPAKSGVGANSGTRRQSTRTASGLVSTRRLGPATVVTKAAAQAALVNTLKSHGGKVEGMSVRGLASLIGATKSTAHNAIAALIAAGTVARIGGELVLKT